VIEAIQAVGKSLSKLRQQVLPPVQSNLRDAIDKVREFHRFQGHSASVLSVAFSPDGKTIVSGSADQTIRLWDLAGNPIGQPFQGHSASVWSVAFSPDGKTIVSGSADQTIRLWDLAGNPIGQPFQGHSASVLSVAFSPDGKTIVSGSADQTIRLWLGGT
jgi:WD40 repeat protein